MRGRTRWLAVALIALGAGPGCCRWCERWCGDRHTNCNAPPPAYCVPVSYCVPVTAAAPNTAYSASQQCWPPAQPAR